MKYRKKPVVIEAMHLPIGGMNENIEEQVDITTWLYNNHMKPGTDFTISEDGWRIFTLEGEMLASWGDWIIKGIQGEFYPCKPAVFEQTYEAVDD